MLNKRLSAHANGFICFIYKVRIWPDVDIRRRTNVVHIDMGGHLARRDDGWQVDEDDDGAVAKRHTTSKVVGRHRLHAGTLVDEMSESRRNRKERRIREEAHPAVSVNRLI